MIVTALWYAHSMAQRKQGYDSMKTVTKSHLLSAAPDLVFWKRWVRTPQVAQCRSAGEMENAAVFNTAIQADLRVRFSCRAQSIFSNAIVAQWRKRKGNMNAKKKTN